MTNIINQNKIAKNLDFEKLVEDLKDDKFLAEYKSKYDDYSPSLLPKLLGGLLVCVGDIVYGKAPSYIKFRAVEVVARVPYQSWSSAAYTLLTLCYTDEKRALELANTKTFARHANDNETMHVVVVSHIVATEHKHASTFLHSIIPMLFSFFYFWMSYVLFLVNRKWSYELNYLFENHAFSQYSIFVNRYEDKLKEKTVDSEFLKWYGRSCSNQYEFFLSVRNDELIHRNYSIEEIEKWEVSKLKI